MAYEIEKQDDFFEVRLSGEGSKAVIFMAVAALMRRDPRKKHPDLWTLSPEFQVPYVEFGAIARALAYVFKPSLVSKTTAVVVANHFQHAQLDLYRLEVCRHIPVNLRIFRSRDAAIAWVKNPDTPRQHSTCQPTT
jgi:hypothetical protein